MPTETPPAAHPRHWPTRLGFALLRAITALPAGPRYAIARGLGRLAWRFGRGLRRDVNTNLDLCFPGLDPASRARLLRDHVDAFGCALVEAGMAWWGDRRELEARTDWSGLEHLETARAGGRGVLMLTGHFTTFELGARLLSLRVPLDVTYKRDKNAAVEALVRERRAAHFGAVIPSDDVRTLVRRLRAGAVVWYAPDQNYRRKGRVFADFLGQPAATNPATARIARAGEAAVVPYAVIRVGDRYRVTVMPALEAFPSGDAEADAGVVNAAIGALVRLAPEQYLWRLRRFSDRPDGMPNPYRGG